MILDESAPIGRVKTTSIASATLLEWQEYMGKRI